ncbi:bifunctional DNA primase/polymerase [Streptomyces sp. NPDC005355]|uniref:bifunctional DNA primase/polymerase n=1 Tax=Streptomyces sp. NPDC005355 TaxID=3157038 RepID=UPI0033A432A3
MTLRPGAGGSSRSPPGGKTPAVRDGESQATADPAQINRWWRGRRWGRCRGPRVAASPGGSGRHRCSARPHARLPVISRTGRGRNRLCVEFWVSTGVNCSTHPGASMCPVGLLVRDMAAKGTRSTTSPIRESRGGCCGACAPY